MTTQKPVQDHVITLDGLRAHYREWGAPDAPPLVILHGAADRARAFDAVAAAFADRLHILVPDLRGHGETDWASDYSIGAFVQDTEQFAEHLHLPTFALLGHSLGANMAFHFAAQYPNRVSRLVLGDVGPDAFAAALWEANLAQFRAAALEAFDDPEEPVRRALAAAAAVLPETGLQAMGARLRDNLVCGSEGRWRWRYDAGGLGANLPSGQEVAAAAWGALGQVRCPTLVIRGENSAVLSRENAERMVRTLAEGRWMEVPASGHGVPWDNFAGYMAVVQPFLLEQVG